MLRERFSSIFIFCFDRIFSFLFHFGRHEKINLSKLRNLISFFLPANIIFNVGVEGNNTLHL